MTEEEGEPLELEEPTLAQQIPQDQYGNPIMPTYPTEDPVQAEQTWYEPKATDTSKNMVTRDMSLSFLKYNDLYQIDLTVDIINITDNIITSLAKQYKENPQDQTNCPKLKPLIEARNDIILEHQSFLTARRAINGQTAKLSRTAGHTISSKYTQENTQPPPKKGLKKLLPI